MELYTITLLTYLISLPRSRLFVHQSVYVGPFCSHSGTRASLIRGGCPSTAGASSPSSYLWKMALDTKDILYHACKVGSALGYADKYAATIY